MLKNLLKNTISKTRFKEIELMSTIIKDEWVVIREINLMDTINFKGDLNALLLMNGVPFEYLHLHIILNGFRNSQEFKGDKIILKLVNLDNLRYLEKIVKQM